MKYIMITLLFVFAGNTSIAEGTLRAKDDPNLKMGRTLTREETSATVVAPDTTITGTDENCCEVKATSKGINSRTNPTAASGSSEGPSGTPEGTTK